MSEGPKSFDADEQMSNVPVLRARKAGSPGVAWSWVVWFLPSSGCGEHLASFLHEFSTLPPWIGPWHALLCSFLGFSVLLLFPLAFNSSLRLPSMAWLVLASLEPIANSFIYCRCFRTQQLE